MARPRFQGADRGDPCFDTPIRSAALRRCLRGIQPSSLRPVFPCHASEGRNNIGHQLNEFEERQLVEWTPRMDDFLKHDDENRTYEHHVFGPYRNKDANYSTCVFPRTPFTHPYEAECVLLKPRDGMRLLELGCGSGAAAYYLASRYNIEIVCVTNSSVQADICRRTLATFGGRGHVIVTDFDTLDLPSESFDAIYALESIGYTKDVDAWLAGCWRMLKPGGRLLIRSPGSLDHCRREKDFRSVTAFFDNWRYNFLGSNLLVYKARGLGFDPIRYRRLPFWACGASLGTSFVTCSCGSTGSRCGHSWNWSGSFGAPRRGSFLATRTTRCLPLNRRPPSGRGR